MATFFRDEAEKTGIKGQIFAAVYYVARNRNSARPPFSLPEAIANIARKISALNPAMAPVAEDVAALLYDQTCIVLETASDFPPNPSSGKTDQPDEF
jgi:hypothetical protein